MPVPEQILQLIETFDRNSDAYHTGGYNETQLRREFIDPFFEALGWDVANKNGYAPAYRDVIHEDAIKIGTATKAPDYSFRIGEARKFFVEAKKPSVDIKEDAHPAYQLRRYAWSAKLPLSILTDFEEFAVYDCLTKPSHTDRASTGRIMYFTCKEYVDHWDEIAQIFSKEAIQRGSFDKFAAKAEGKRGTSTVDKEFLKEIESWRKNLATHIARQNRELGTAEVNFAVQRTIDRILFLRMCEDRGIEPYGQLLAIKNGREVYHRLGGLFEKADAKYNSGLFYFRQEKGRNELPDEMTLGLNVPDEPIGWILHRLYYPQPYEFSVIPPEILGNVYEQFLGKVIRITPARMVKIEDKPEVKKAGGVYYTPEYIVDYIVKNTVGKLCEGKTPKEISKLRILDPACGSGSFLLGAYTYLLNYYRDWYVANEPEKYAKQLYQGKGGHYFLTIAEKKQILLNNIHGVDIDSQAVEVTKLSLLLKVLEGESQETVQQVFRIFHERALPDLGNNIKCGNSLIGTDFYDNLESDKITDELRNRINAFDWQKEFPAVFKQGGFNAVIGNPPWGGDIDKELAYFHKVYPDAVQKTTDSFKLFISKSCKLVTTNGYISMIVPQTLLRQNRYSDVRALLVGFTIKSLIDLGENVFEKVVAPSTIFVVKKSPYGVDNSIEFIDLRHSPDNSEKSTLLKNPVATTKYVKQDVFLKTTDFAFVPKASFGNKVWPKLGDLHGLRCRDAGINYQRVGVGMSVKGNSDLGQRLLYEGSREKPSHLMFWKGTDIGRYWTSKKTNRFCRSEIKNKLRPNEVIRLAVEVYKQVPKILLRQTADRIYACIDSVGVWFGRSVLCITAEKGEQHRLEYILGLLNSKYLDYLYQAITGEKGRVFAQVKFAKLKQLPIRTIDFANRTDKVKHDKMVSLVERMLDLHKKLVVAKVPDEKTKIQRQIDSTDSQIDSLVYDLYGLTPEEIKIIEDSAK